MQKEILKEMLAQNRVTCSFSLDRLTPENAVLRLNPQAASAGFIFRHIGETMHLFGQFFGLPTDIKNTTVGQKDEDRHYDVAESRLLVQQGYEKFEKYVEDTPDTAWLDPIETPFFGTVSRIRLFSHVFFHTSHHAGQISLTLAKGT